MSWMRKQSGKQEISNLKYMLNVVPNLLPEIADIGRDYYIIEYCTPINPESFSPTKFNILFQELIQPLNCIRRNIYTPGIYKYYEEINKDVNQKVDSYISYVLNEFDKVINNFKVRLPKLIYDNTFSLLLNNIYSTKDLVSECRPVCYSLLHGDLHIGNIVEKRNKPLLIDFEFVRFGLPETEIANLIISILSWQFRKDNQNNDTIFVYNEYLNQIEKLSLCNLSLVKFYISLLFCLSYARASLINDNIEIEMIKDVTLCSHKS